MMDRDTIWEAVRGSCGLGLNEEDTADEVVRRLGLMTQDEVVGGEIAKQIIAKIDASLALAPPSPSAGEEREVSDAGDEPEHGAAEDEESVDWYDVDPKPCSRCRSDRTFLNSYFRPDSAEVCRVECRACGYRNAEEFAPEPAIAQWGAQWSAMISQVNATTPAPSPEIAEHHRTVEKLEAVEGQIASLKAALEPFADLGVGSGPDDEHDNQPYRILRGAIRRARSLTQEDRDAP